MERCINSPLLYFALIGNPKEDKGKELFGFLNNSIRQYFKFGEIVSNITMKNVYLKSYQEGAGSKSFGRHLLTELVKDAFDIKRQEIEDSDMYKERNNYEPVIQDLKLKYEPEYQAAVNEVKEIALETQKYCDRSGTKGTILLYRNIPKGNKYEEDYLKAGKQKDKIEYYSNILASYTDSKSVKLDYGDDRSGITIKRKVPINDIIFHYGYFLDVKNCTDFADEREIIILHRQEKVTLNKPDEGLI